MYFSFTKEVSMGYMELSHSMHCVCILSNMPMYYKLDYKISLFLQYILVVKHILKGHIWDKKTWHYSTIKSFGKSEL
jgi:hypothetical protein